MDREFYRIGLKKQILSWGLR